MDSLKKEVWIYQYLLNKECAVRRTPLITWKSPLWNRFTISVNKSGHFCGKSSLPIMLIASLNWGKEKKWIKWKFHKQASFLNNWDFHYLLLNLLRAAQHQVHYVGFNGYSVSFTNLIQFIFNLKAKHQQHSNISPYPWPWIWVYRENRTNFLFSCFLRKTIKEGRAFPLHEWVTNSFNNLMKASTLPQKNIHTLMPIKSLSSKCNPVKTCSENLYRPTLPSPHLSSGPSIWLSL